MTSGFKNTLEYLASPNKSPAVPFRKYYSGISIYFPFAVDTLTNEIQLTAPASSA